LKGKSVPKAKIGGFTVHYQQMGHGPDLVLIHGLFGNLAFWYLSVLPALARDFRVTVYDLRGHGFSDMPAFGYRTHDLAYDLENLVDYLGINQAHIVGHSYGGAVGLHFTILNSKRVLSLTLADARVPCLQPLRRARNSRRRNLVIQRLRRAGIEIPADLPRVVDSYMEELARLPFETIQQMKPKSWSSTWQLSGWNGNSLAAKRWFHLVRTTSAAEDFSRVDGLTPERIDQVKKPALAIYGKLSNCLPTLRGLEQHVPNISKIMVPGVGHFHPVLKPDVFVQHLEHFISKMSAENT
jgi:pimeloyl-ACP methyl ester carboxylesterase